MIARIKIIKTKEGSESQFETLFNKLDEYVKANEPHIISHELYRSPKNPRNYVVVEKYPDQSALDVHTESERKFFNDIILLLESVTLQTSLNFEEMSIPI